MADHDAQTPHELIKRYAGALIRHNSQPGFKVLVLTDPRTDERIWRALLEVAEESGCEPLLGMMAPRKDGNFEPPEPLAEAWRHSDLTVLATSTSMAQSRARTEAMRAGKLTIFMEGLDVETMTTGAATADYPAMHAQGLAIRLFFVEGVPFHLTSPGGTDLQGVIGKRTWLTSGLANRDPVIGGGICGFPDGEVGGAPAPGSGEGTLVWDLAIHHQGYSVVLDQPIVIAIRGGRAVQLSGGPEAARLEAYIQAYGDENSFNCPAELSMGLNPKARLRGVAREDKKLKGTVHVAMGKMSPYVESKLHIDGLIARPSLTLGGHEIMRDGRILVEPDRAS